MTETQNDHPERIWASAYHGSLATDPLPGHCEYVRGDIHDETAIMLGDAYGAHAEGTKLFQQRVEHEVHKRLARPAPAEGAVKPLEWDDRNRAQGYRVQPTYGQDRKPYILTRDGKIIWAYDTIDDAKAEAQADWERRILSALASPEDATPAAPVSVEEAARVLLDAYTSEGCEVDFNPAWAAYERANGIEDVRAYEGMAAFLRALAGKKETDHG